MPTMRSPIAARYRGKCLACGEWFAEGSLIVSSEGGWRHFDCDNDGIPEAKPRPVCDRCWLETSATGLCGCDA